MRTKLNGKHLVLSANYPRAPYFYTELIDQTYNSNQNSYNHRITDGIDFKFISTLSQYFNFTWSSIYANNVWGNKLPNGTWNGMIGDVHYGRADLALGDLSITYDRSPGVDFTSPYLFAPITFLTRSDLKLSKMAILRPFDMSVWVTMFVTFIISSFSMHICLILTSSKSRIDYLDPQNLEVYWIPIESLLLKSSKRFLIMTKLRLYNIVWKITSVILWVIYTTYLLNMMTNMQEAHSINSIQQLVHQVEQHKLRVCTWAEAPMAYPLLKKTNLRSITNAVEQFPMFNALELMLTSAKNLVSISNVLRLRTFQKLFGETNFKLKSNQETSIVLDLISIALPKTSSITKHFNKIISILQSTGHFKSWINSATDAVLKQITIDNKFNISNINFQIEVIESEDVIKLKHLSIVIYIFLICLGTASLVLILENLISTNTKKLKLII